MLPAFTDSKMLPEIHYSFHQLLKVCFLSSVFLGIQALIYWTEFSKNGGV